MNLNLDRAREEHIVNVKLGNAANVINASCLQTGLLDDASAGR
jgi:hypothetical protein